MARVIPSYFLPETPPGEQALHKALAESDGTEDWIALHSLAIAEHVKKPEGEADFVVIVPDHGILVIEVKSHLTVDCRGSVWRLGNEAPTVRGPFKQAGEAMHSLRKYLLKKNVDLSSSPVLSAAWFTGVRARTMLPESPEWHDWQVLDSEDLKNGVVAAILRTLKSGAAHLGRTTYVTYGAVGPDEATARRVESLLRPRFEVGVVAGDLRSARERTNSSTSSKSNATRSTPWPITNRCSSPGPPGQARLSWRWRRRGASWLRGIEAVSSVSIICSAGV